MTKFTFHTGHRPLPDYTIKRGIGQGGFGEVYFALTEGGKEAAIKWIHKKNHDIELRGIQRCLNLKHPNLVHLYDVRTDKNGDHWLIMEYVNSKTLAAIIASYHPAGVPTDMVAQWFLGLAQAIQYLHQHGIVHRDLKPANIFLENGIIKVGDYGLCKNIADSHRGGMTKEVGTAHYMAPEIRTGNYSRSVNIYAAGILLFEMLTGQVPFDGESQQEILMKHMHDVPDLSKVPEEFKPIVRRAIEKDPKVRYQTIGEMAKEVAALANANQTWAAAPTPVAQTQPTQTISQLPMAIPVTPTMIFQQRWSELSGILLWSVVVSAILAVAWPLFFGGGDYSKLAAIFFMTVAASWSVLIPSKLWVPTSEDDSWTRRLVLMSLGFGVALLGLWLEGYELPFPWTPSSRLEILRPYASADMTKHVSRHAWLGWIYGPNTSMPILACYLSYFGLMFLMLRWWKTTELKRPSRFSFLAFFAVAFWGYFLLFLLPTAYHREIGFVSLVMAAIVCQVTCPWKEKTPVRKKTKMRLAVPA